MNEIHAVHSIGDELSFTIFAANRYGLKEGEAIALLATLDNLVSSTSATPLQSMNAFGKEELASFEVIVQPLIDALQQAHSGRTMLTADVQVKDNDKRNWKATAWKEVCESLASVLGQPLASVVPLRDCTKIGIARKSGVIAFRITIDGNSSEFRRFYESIQ